MAQASQESDTGDLEIVVGLLDQDEAALRALVARYGGAVKAFLRWKFPKLLQEPEIREVLNRVAFNAWRKIEQFDDKKGPLKRWLLRIAYNEAVSLLREEPVSDYEQLLERDPVEHLSTPGSDDPLNKDETKVIQDLRAVIAALPPLQRDIIESDMYSDDVADAKRLAQKHGSSVNSIYVSRKKARDKIADEMRKRGHFQLPDNKRR